jgi:undecaprenyl-diphosphatase
VSESRTQPIWVSFVFATVGTLMLLPSFLHWCFYAAARQIHEWDLTVTDWCLRQSPWWRPLSRLGDGPLYLLCFLWMRTHGQSQKAEHMALCIFFAWGMGSALKFTTRRQRRNPVRAGFLRRRSGMLTRIYSWSFPSQHAACAVAFAYALWPNPLALAVAATVSASRVLIGVHYLGDVLAGIAVGLVAGRLA